MRCKSTILSFHEYEVKNNITCKDTNKKYSLGVLYPMACIIMIL